MDVDNTQNSIESTDENITIVEPVLQEWQNQAYYLPRTTMKQNYLACNRFILLHKLGKGGFGLIYAGVDIVTGREVAIKLEDIEKARKKYLRLEYKIYKRLSSDWFHVPCHQDVKVPTVYHYGQDGGFRILVMELLGVALSEIFVFCKQRFSIKTVCLLAIKMINCVEFFHAKGMLHRDVKPGNFVLGKGDNGGDLYLIDYGLASPYIDAEGRHIPYSTDARFHGTDQYASINNHNKIEPGRRDDLESVGYLAVYFAKGNLPWVVKYPRAQKPERRKLYGDCKQETSIKELCSGLPRNFAEFFLYVKKLHFADKPDYDYLRFLFFEILRDNGFEFDDVFDWTIE
jgi:serine/threonine protein kinase